MWNLWDVVFYVSVKFPKGKSFDYYFPKGKSFDYYVLKGKSFEDLF